MGAWRRFFEDLNLILPLLGVFIGAVSFAFIAGGWFHAQQLDLLLTTTIGGAVGLVSALLAGVVIGRLPISQLRRSLKELQDESASTRTALSAAQAQLQEKVPVPSSVEAPSDTLTLPPPSVQIWLRSMRQKDEDDLYRATKIPILLVANLKGGVAKTMTAANLAAYFATRSEHHTNLKSKRVLLIDLDYQASLTNMVLNAFAVGNLHPEASARTLFSEDVNDVDALHRGVLGTDQFKKIRFFPCEYGFDDFETRAQFNWLSSANANDVRLSLLRRLRSPTFQQEFDLIILDTGPRLTTGSVAALAASTHLLVPTTSDRRSVLAAEQFLRRVAEMKRGFAPNDGRPVRICPEIRVAGILQTLTTSYANDVVLQDQAKAGLEAVLGSDSHLHSMFVQGFGPVLNNTLRRSSPVVNQAQAGIPYSQGAAARRVFDDVGLEVERRLQS